MYGAQWSSPSDGCAGWAEAFNGSINQIQKHDDNLIAVSRAPIDKIEEVRKSMDWTFQWASSINSDFSED
jgi:predicted dithiol-disulfide oxidoreductase (DUF899 family)